MVAIELPVQMMDQLVSILILLDYLFLYSSKISVEDLDKPSLNPYFIGLSILILNKYFNFIHFYNIVSILILLDYLFL